MSHVNFGAKKVPGLIFCKNLDKNQYINSSQN